MADVKDGGPAFPLEKDRAVDGSFYYPAQHVGMSLRDYFAARALGGMLSQPADTQYTGVFHNPDTAATWAYEFADAMLKARQVTHA